MNKQDRSNVADLFFVESANRSILVGTIGGEALVQTAIRRFEEVWHGFTWSFSPLVPDFTPGGAHSQPSHHLLPFGISPGDAGSRGASTLRTWWQNLQMWGDIVPPR